MTRLAARIPSQTRRWEESEQLQQFSSPVPLSFVAAQAAALIFGDIVLEPSAGTGLLAIFAKLAQAQLVLNHIAEVRAGLLGRLFREVAVTGHNAEQIHDRLDPAIRPSVVLMNPPFSASPHVEGRFAEAAMRHIASALARLAEGGRLVAITGRNTGPDQPAWRESFVDLHEKGRVVFTAGLAGQAYARHGTTIETRLTVIDRVPAEDPGIFPPSPGMAADTAQLLDWVSSLVPPREQVAGATPLPAPVFPIRAPTAARPKIPASQLALVKRPAPTPDFAELVYEFRDWRPSASFTANLYEAYALQTIHFPGAQPHPTKLVQSAAMAAVAPPRPSYRPHLPPRLLTDGILSDAQCESIVYAGEAHAGHLAGSYTLDETYDIVTAAPADAANAVRFRRGWFLGDGTGAGKGRQVAAVILDNWLKGRRRALWISKSDKLIEDAERDWTALGGYRSDIVPLLRFRQGAAIALAEGILSPPTPRCARRRGPGRPAACNRSSTGSDAISMASSSSTKRTPWPMPPATRACPGLDPGESAARRSPLSRARPDCACSTRCMTHACSMSRRREPPRCKTSPMLRGWACGVPAIFPSRRAPILSRPWKRAVSPPWRCWRAISRPSGSMPPGHCPSRASNMRSSSTR